jgi:DNA-binding NarL/FixJ family response regulator
MVSAKTLEAHVCQIFQKLDLHESPDDHRRVLAYSLTFVRRAERPGAILAE